MSKLGGECYDGGMPYTGSNKQNHQLVSPRRSDAIERLRAAGFQVEDLSRETSPDGADICLLIGPVYPKTDPDPLFGPIQPQR